MPPRELTDDYRLERILGSSRGGSILRASRIDTGKTVVIKLFNVPALADPSRAPKLVERFGAQAAVLATIRHPNLPRVLDSGITPDGGAFLVMEKLEGAGFEDDGSPGGAGAGPDRILPLLAQALDGLEELARHGIAHLNLNPENLLLVPGAAAHLPGEPPLPTVKLLGLGTALFHLGEPWPEPQVARFRAPELALPAAAEQAAPDWRADCYALAVTACYALGATVAAGEVGGTPVQTVQMPLALSFDLANDEALRQILELCLRQSPRERPAHAAIREAFRLALGDTELPASPAPPLTTASGPAATASGQRRAPAEPEPAGRPRDLRPEGRPMDHGGPRTPLFGSDLARSGGSAGPGDWRSLLSGSQPPPEKPSWQTAALGEAPAELGASAGRGGTARSAGDSAMAGAAATGGAAADAGAGGRAFGGDAAALLGGYEAVRSLAGPGDEALAGGGDAAGAAAFDGGGARSGEGSDHPLDLFDVPATLPDLSDTDVARGARSSFGFHFPEGFDLAPDDPLFAGGAQDVPGVDLASGGPGGPGGPDPGGPGSFSAAAPGAPAGWAPPPLLTLPTPAPAAGDLAAAAGKPGATPARAPMAAGAGIQAPAGVHAAQDRAAGALPSTTGPAPPPGGELLSGVDELLDSLPPPPPSAAPQQPARGGRRAATAAASAAGAASGGRATATPAPRATAAAPAAGGRPAAALLGLPRPVLLAGIGALLLAVVAAAWLLLRHGSGQAPAAPQETAGGPAAADSTPQRPGRSAEAKLFDARSYLIFGRESDGRVRQALRELTFADQADLGPAGCRQLAAIQQVLAAEALESVQPDLAAGLRGGDLGLLESVVEVASDQDVQPKQKGDLDRARGLVNQYELARAAATAGDQAQVLERFRTMEGLSRNLHDPLELRDRAAQTLETEAHALAADGKYDEALGRIGPILRHWPERAGLKDLAKRYETAAASEPQQEVLLDSVPAYESRHRPSEALDLMRPMQPTPHLEQRFGEARQRLEALLARLDAQPPQVELRPGYALDYWRGTVINLSFRVTDDYEVKSVKLFARPEGGRMTELPLQKAGFGWDVQIPPSFHQNGTVDFYVVATDLSGHEGTLGSRDNPLRVKRRQGFQQLLH